MKLTCCSYFSFVYLKSDDNNNNNNNNNDNDNDNNNNNDDDDDDDDDNLYSLKIKKHVSYMIKVVKKHPKDNLDNIINY